PVGPTRRRKPAADHAALQGWGSDGAGSGGRADNVCPVQRCLSRWRGALPRGPGESANLDGSADNSMIHTIYPRIPSRGSLVLLSLASALMPLVLSGCSKEEKEKDPVV